MMNIFVDCDVAYDLLDKRAPHLEMAGEIFDMFSNKKAKGFISSLSYANLHYLLTKQHTTPFAIKLLKGLRELTTVSGVTQSTIDQAIDSDFNDFEDAIQYYSALSVKADYIITRNVKDFKHSEITVLSPKEFLAL